VWGPEGSPLRKSGARSKTETNTKKICYKKKNIKSRGACIKSSPNYIICQMDSFIVNTKLFREKSLSSAQEAKEIICIVVKISDELWYVGELSPR